MLNEESRFSDHILEIEVVKVNGFFVDSDRMAMIEHSRRDSDDRYIFRILCVDPGLFVLIRTIGSETSYVEFSFEVGILFNFDSDEFDLCLTDQFYNLSKWPSVCTISLIEIFSEEAVIER
jgi:hypothetical protein